MEREKPLTQPVPEKKAKGRATKQMEILLNEISALEHIKQHLPQTTYITDVRNHVTA